MPTPGRYPPPGVAAPALQGQQDNQPQKPAMQHGPGSLAPVRHQPTPPTSGIGAPPQQVALVPMVLRGPYAPGGPIIFDPYAPPGAMGALGAMGAMGGMSGMGAIAGTPLVFPPGTPMQTIVGQAAGYDGQRPGAMGRYNNRRSAMRMDRSMQFGPNGHHNQVDVQRIRDGVDVRTTVGCDCCGKDSQQRHGVGSWLTKILRSCFATSQIRLISGCSKPLLMSRAGASTISCIYASTLPMTASEFYSPTFEIYFRFHSLT